MVDVALTLAGRGALGLVVDVALLMGMVFFKYLVREII